MLSTETTVAQQRPAHLFKPGQSGNPAGRPVGARHKLGTLFLEEMLKDFDKHGPSVIEAVRTEKPDQYLKVVASILPKEIEAGENLSNVLEDILSRIDGRTRNITPVYELVDATKPTR